MKTKTNDIRNVPMTEWGKDHWSMLAYVETCCVDNGGVPDPIRLRCNPKRHQQFQRISGPCTDKDGAYKYPTRLGSGQNEPEHDDWDCFYDMEAAGLLTDVGTGIRPIAKLTDAGQKMAAKLRVWKASGGMYAAFKVEP